MERIHCGWLTKSPPERKIVGVMKWFRSVSNFDVSFYRQYAFCLIYLVYVFFCMATDIGDGNTDRREIFQDGRAYRSVRERSFPLLGAVLPRDLWA